MSPPQLTADTPVLDVLHPVAIGILILGRIEFQFVIHYRRQCHICKMLHLEKPLHRKLRLYNHVGTLGIPYLIGIGFHLIQQAGSIQVFFNLFTNIKAIHTDIKTGSLAQCTIIVEDIDAWQVILFTQHIVVHIMRRSYFQATCTELNIYIIIFDYRDHTIYQRNDYSLTFQPFILRVVRIDTHSGITHDRFRTGSSYHSIASFRITFHFIAQIIQFAMLFLVDNFFIRKGSQSLRVPVYHTYTTVNQSLIIKVYKYFQYTFATLFIHSESGAVPITGSTEFTQLLQDDATMFICPLPGMLQEFVTGKICLLDTLCSQLIYYLRFRSDRSVVSTRYPAGIFTFHTGTAYQNILNGIIKHVSHVEHAGDVRGRNDDGVRLTTIGF